MAALVITKTKGNRHVRFLVAPRLAFVWAYRFGRPTVPRGVPMIVGRRWTRLVLFLKQSEPRGAGPAGCPTP